MRWGLPLGLVLLSLLLSGCDGVGDPGLPVVPRSVPVSARPPTSAISPTAVRPEVTVGACPYLDTAAVADIIGQHLTRTAYTVTAADLLPGCTFSRPDGGVGLDVAVTRYPDAISAQNAAAALGTVAANPVTDLGGYAVVLVGADRTVLALAHGAVLLSVTINQESSLEAHEIAELVLAQLP